VHGLHPHGCGNGVCVETARTEKIGTPTPGPWFPVQNQHYWEIRTRNGDHAGEQIGDACSSNFLIAGPNGEANARLMAAAPDLLNFARQVLDYATDAECFYLMSLAENIIQKVEGKS
jgi:hypothetical protein